MWRDVRVRGSVVVLVFVDNGPETTFVRWIMKISILLLFSLTNIDVAWLAFLATAWLGLTAFWWWFSGQWSNSKLSCVVVGRDGLFYYKVIKSSMLKNIRVRDSRFLKAKLPHYSCQEVESIDWLTWRGWIWKPKITVNQEVKREGVKFLMPGQVRE